MQRWIGAAIVAVALGLTSAASAQPFCLVQGRRNADQPAPVGDEFSSRHRGRAHAQRPARRPATDMAPGIVRRRPLRRGPTAPVRTAWRTFFRSASAATAFSRPGKHDA